MNKADRSIRSMTILTATASGVVLGALLATCWVVIPDMKRRQIRMETRQERVEEGIEMLLKRPY